MKIKDEREQLEQMINQSSEKIGNEINSIAPELKSEPMFTDNFNDIHKECDKQAKKLIQKVTGFILSDELIKQNPYLKNKIQVDIISLSGMLYQLSVNETMQKTLMEEVRSGATHPRMFEVFSQLSKTIGDLNKQLLQTTEAIKSTYRDIKNDIREKNQDMLAIGESGLTKNSKGILALGTKELIRETKRLKLERKQNEEVIIQDVEEIQ